MSRGKKVEYTITIYACFCTYGLASTMLASARLDIAQLMSVSFAQISYGAVGRSVGYVVAAFLFGWLYSRMSRQLGLVACLVVSGFSMFVVPFTRTLALYVFLEFVFGFFNAGIDVACNSWILEIWQEDANPFMQGMHFFLATGFALAPVLVAPFLSIDEDALDADNVTLTSENGTGSPFGESHVVVPYSIGSMSMVLAAVGLLVLHFLSPYPQQQRSVSAPKTTAVAGQEAAGSATSDYLKRVNAELEANRYRIQLLTLGAALLFSYTGLELATFAFIPEFVHVIALRLSKARAAFLSSVMMAAFAVSRLVSIVIAAKLRHKTMLYGSYALLVLGNLILLLTANSSQTGVWIGVMILGAGHSCVYPCIMSFLETRVNMTTTVCGLLMLATCLSPIVVPIIMANCLEAHPLTFCYVNIFFLTAICASFATLWLVDRRFRRRRKALAGTRLSLGEVADDDDDDKATLAARYRANSLYVAQ